LEKVTAAGELAAFHDAGCCSPLFPRSDPIRGPGILVTAVVQRINTHAFQQAVSWVLVALVLYFVYSVVKAFLVPLTWAAVLTIFFFPVHRWVARKVL